MCALRSAIIQHVCAGRAEAIPPPNTKDASNQWLLALGLSLATEAGFIVFYKSQQSLRCYTCVTSDTIWRDNRQIGSVRVNMNH